ncbi:hypothetical protein D3C72_2313630 [compost metagenome]
MDAGDGRAGAIDGPKTAGTFTGNFYAGLDPNEALFQAWPQVMASGAIGTLAQWQAAGYDKGSFTVDPQFTDAAHDNFAPAAGSAVYQHGFDHLPFDQIGLLG